MKNLCTIDLNKEGEYYIVSILAKRVSNDETNRFYYAIARDGFYLHHYLVPSATLAYRFDCFEDINPKVLYNHLKKTTINSIKLIPESMAYHKITVSEPIKLEVKQ